jgi:hypothetical protein
VNPVFGWEKIPGKAFDQFAVAIPGDYFYDLNVHCSLRMHTQIFCKLLLLTQIVKSKVRKKTPDFNLVAPFIDFFLPIS